ncbi:hypothetical protein HDV00_011626 [Rhizophlyctis rosea]|nr:hypothetical protein HDV00_011626 [Rhizophlyctis rosea]
MRALPISLSLLLAHLTLASPQSNTDQPTIEEPTFPNPPPLNCPVPPPHTFAVYNNPRRCLLCSRVSLDPIDPKYLYKPDLESFATYTTINETSVNAILYDDLIVTFGSFTTAIAMWNDWLSFNSSSLWPQPLLPTKWEYEVPGLDGRGKLDCACVGRIDLLTQCPGAVQGTEDLYASYDCRRTEGFGGRILPERRCWEAGGTFNALHVEQRDGNVGVFFPPEGGKVGSGMTTTTVAAAPISTSGPVAPTSVGESGPVAPTDAPVGGGNGGGGNGGGGSAAPAMAPGGGSSGSSGGDGADSGGNDGVGPSNGNASNNGNASGGGTNNNGGGAGSEAGSVGDSDGTLIGPTSNGSGALMTPTVTSITSSSMGTTTTATKATNTLLTGGSLKTETSLLAAWGAVGAVLGLMVFAV